MSFRYSTNDYPIIRISGEADFDNCREAVNHIGSLLSKTCEPVCIEMDSLDFIDSSGLIKLASVASDARQSSKPIKITSLNTRAEQILKVAGVWNMFDIPSDVSIRPREAINFPESRLMNIDISPLGRNCRLARNGIAAFGYQMGIRGNDLHDMKLAIGEALSNAIRHGTTDNETIKILCIAENGRFQVLIRYPSEQFDPDIIPKPNVDELCEGGMGIFLIRYLMDSLEYAFENGWVIMSMVKQLNTVRN